MICGSHVVNLYTDELGNRELPEKFQQAKATLTAPPTSAPVAKPVPRSRGLIAALIIVAALAGAGGFYIFSIDPARKRCLLPPCRQRQLFRRNPLPSSIREFERR